MASRTSAKGAIRSAWTRSLLALEPLHLWDDVGQSLTMLFKHDLLAVLVAVYLIVVGISNLLT